MQSGIRRVAVVRLVGLTGAASLGLRADATHAV